MNPIGFARTLAWVGVMTAAVAPSAHAEWTYERQPQVQGKGFVVTDGNKSFVVTDEKAARQSARALNKADRKAKRKAAKEDDGFKAEETGPCAKPVPGMNC
jgi:hypothetical protein